MRDILYRFSIIIGLLVLAACVSVQDQITAVKNRAAYDFSCDAAKIKVTYLQSDTYGAEGCKMKQVYTTEGSMVYKEGAAPNPVYVEPPIYTGVGYYGVYR